VTVSPHAQEVIPPHDAADISEKVLENKANARINRIVYNVKFSVALISFILPLFYT